METATLIVFASVLIAQVFATVAGTRAAGAAVAQMKLSRPIVKVWDSTPAVEDNKPITGTFRRQATNVGSATAFDMHSRLTFFDATNVVIFQQASPFDQDLPAAQDTVEDYHPAQHAGWSDVLARLNKQEAGIHYRVDVRYRFDPAAVEWYGSTHFAKVRFIPRGWQWTMAGGSELDRPAAGRLFPVNQPQ